MGGWRQIDTGSVYHPLPLALDTDSVCWHCCEPIQNKSQLIPLPRMYDAFAKVYHVYGATCSPGCAKQYIIEHTSFDRGNHLNVLIKMLRDLYGISESVISAPPRPALKRFGGAFDPQSQTKAECSILQPPFVSYCMLVEEKIANGAFQSDMHVNGITPMNLDEEEEASVAFEEPTAPGLYLNYLENVQGQTEDTHQAEEQPTRSTPTSKAKSSKRLCAPMPSGPMSKFMKTE